VLEVDVASGFNVASVGVVIEFIRFELHLRGFNPNSAPEVAKGAVYFLGDRLDEDVLGVGRSGSKRASREVHIRAEGRDWGRNG
jgi:hypothetical protein